MGYMYERGVVDVKISIYRKEKERKSVLLSFYILILRYHTLLELSLHSETIPPL